MSDSSAPLNLLIGAARRAARGLSRDLGELEQLQNSPKNAARYARAGRERARAVLREVLSTANPAYGWIDETGREDGRDPRRHWAAEPVSGIANFAHGSPGFALSAAYVRNGHTEAAIILDPASGEIFTVRRGAGARRENYRLRVSGRRRQEDWTFGGPLPEPGADDSLRKRALHDLFQAATLGAGLRGTGSAALDFAWVAAGRYDGAWARGERTVGILAGVLLVEESGGSMAPADVDASPTDATVVATPAAIKPLTKALGA